jgi:hypothetical protein
LPQTYLPAYGIVRKTAYQMNERHTTFYADKIETINYCNTEFFLATGSNFELPFNIQPPNGYEEPINEKTGEKFPNCCQLHKNIFDRVQIKVTKFPYCCDGHKRLIKAGFFDRKKYKKTAIKVVKQFNYTEYHISKHIELSSWYEDIYHYIELNRQSFGAFPNEYGCPLGLHEYLIVLKVCLNDPIWLPANNIPIEKGKRLLQFIENYYKQSNESSTDIKLLIEIYQKWLNLFPFSIEYYFKGLKQQFQQSIPLLAEKPIKNPYTGLSGAKLTTPKQLITFLGETTKTLLGAIKTQELIDKKAISDLDKHKFELLKESHRVKQDSLVGTFLATEMGYLSIIDQWLTNESVYFEKMELYLSKPKKDAPAPTVNPIFDYSNKEKYFIPDKLSTFKEIEKELITREYINSGTWIKEKQTLVAFIHILIKLKYLKPKLINKKENTTLISYRRFFEERYNIDIAAQMQPSKFTIAVEKKQMPHFIFIPDIENL